MDYKIKKIKDTKDYYVDTNGVIYRAINNDMSKIKCLSPKINNSGYLRVTYMTSSGETNQALAHRVVASTFLPNIDNLATVNHKDGIKTNNSLYNLEWMSLSDNVRHAFSTGLNKGRKPVLLPNELVASIKSDYNGEFGDRTKIIKKYGIDSRKLLEIIGPYDKNGDLDSPIAEEVKSLYTGKHGDLKMISEKLNITPYTIKKYIVKK